jgi:hypothetical protein
MFLELVVLSRMNSGFGDVQKDYRVCMSRYRALVTVPHAPFTLQCSCSHYADIVARLLLVYPHAQPRRRSRSSDGRLFCSLSEVL